ncbi:class IV adenylate cyclase [Candidatus Kaiserbacteria bacterium CG10_big_fil_rev_8_21_14_0_10_56_12]|uniref:Class IV adenylate cyclase n=1 Tax=Candidatus Kaiserbacteria bacterium CG10_big_fil_rev_8_21_14_0_10_56_12 TaxID=1974611 RepID=A0A2H0U965_9BACT|nr:MAG: class IV adenylate cyclase [Candidatus Kaiserbacteria bacterium CG10_big_fil_rev_8_21_14_0_10_56_12]
MQEIEVKAHLRDREAVVEKLVSLGCTLSDPLQQDDTVYVADREAIHVFAEGNLFLRIRVNNGSEVIFTAKKRSGPLVALEHEVTVSSRAELKGIIAMFGFEKFLTIKKARQTTHYDGCEICIDEVEGLGAFIEMEKLSRDGDPASIQAELFAFLESLGVRREDRVNNGYDILLFERERAQ